MQTHKWAEETTEDREQQLIAAFQLERHLNQLGVTSVTLKETPKDAHLPYDFEMFINGMYTSVVEVKVRNLYSDKIEEYGSIVVEAPRLRRLSEKFYKTSAVNPDKKYWNKEVIFVFRCTLDDVCYAINMREIQRLRKEGKLEKARPDQLTADHGEGRKKVAGYLVPVSAMEKFS